MNIHIMAPHSFNKHYKYGDRNSQIFFFTFTSETTVPYQKDERYLKAC